MASFIVTLAYRIFTEQNLKKLLIKRSHCESCGYDLQWFDLIPVFSWIGLSGKCRKCGEKINFWYFISEVLLGMNFVLPFIVFIPWNHFALSILLYFLSAFDILFMKMPKKVVHVLLGFGVAYFAYRAVTYFIIDYTPYKMPLIEGELVLMRTWVWFLLPIAEAFVFGLLFFIINKFKKAFGFGDTLVLFLIALFTQRIFIVTKTFAGAIVLGAIVAIPLIITDKEWQKRHIPFVPLLYLSFIIVNIFFL